MAGSWAKEVKESRQQVASSIKTLINRRIDWKHKFRKYSLSFLIPDSRLPLTPSMPLSHLLQDFLQFLQKPRPEAAEIPSSEKILPVIFLSVFAVAAGVMAGIVPGLLQKSGLIEPLDLSRMKMLVEKLGVSGLLLFACVAAPILEEILFRWHLTSSRLSVTFFTIAFLLIVAGYVTPGVPIINFLLGFFAVIGLIALWLTKDPALLRALETRWRKWYTFVFYLTALIFALYHITNYSPSARQLAFAPLIVLPQLAAALFFGYTRVRYGLTWSMLMHGLYNAVLIGTSIATGEF
jgi:hypothetical protein